MLASLEHSFYIPKMGKGHVAYRYFRTVFSLPHHFSIVTLSYPYFKANIVYISFSHTLALHIFY